LKGFGKACEGAAEKFIWANAASALRENWKGKRLQCAIPRALGYILSQKSKQKPTRKKIGRTISTREKALSLPDVRVHLEK